MIQDDREFRLLVTIGSTLFPTLTNLVLSPSFLSLLLNLEVTSLVVQYGRANSVSHEGLDLSLDAGGNGRTIWKGNKVNTQEKGKGKGKEKRNEMDVMVMRYTDNLEDLIAGVDAVISHAGSGSILSVFRTKPGIRLLVVPNTSLMDNHQAQLADALAQQGNLMVSSINGLEDDLQEFLRPGRTSVKFPPVDNNKFRGIMDGMMGFVS